MVFSATFIRSRHFGPLQPLQGHYKMRLTAALQKILKYMVRLLFSSPNNIHVVSDALELLSVKVLWVVWEREWEGGKEVKGRR